MRKSVRAGVLACAVLGMASPPARPVRAEQSNAPAPGAVVPVPPNVRAEGLPSIPATLPDALLPYASSRRALLLGWHPVRREILIWTALANVGQIHSVAGPGMDRRQLTFFRDGVSAPLPQSTAAWYAPGGEYFLFAKDTGGGAETTQLFRYDSATRQATMVTDGRSRIGAPVWAHRAG